MNLLTPLATFFGIIISAAIAVRSWFVIAKNNNDHEVFKKLLDLRIETLSAAHELFTSNEKLEYWEDMEKREKSKNLFDKLRTNIMICGTKEEITLWEDFYGKYEILMNHKSQENADNLNKSWEVIRKKIADNLREELNVKKRPEI